MKVSLSIIGVLVGGALGLDIIAHRGFSGIHPESTLSSYVSAVENGAKWLECDVVPSKDGVVYCSHEPHLAELNSDVVMFRHRKTFPLEGIRRATVERAPDGNYFNVVQGWFLSDYNSADIDTLKVAQRYIERDQSKSRTEPFLKLSELLEFAKENKRGVYIEPKHSDWFYDVAGIELNGLILETIAAAFSDRMEIITVDEDEMPKIDLDIDTLPESEREWWTDTLESAFVKAKGKQVKLTKDLDVPVIIESFLYEDLAFYKYMGWSDANPTCALTWDARGLEENIWGETYVKGAPFVDERPPSSSDAEWQDDSGPTLRSVAVDEVNMAAVNAKYLGPDKSLVLKHDNLVSTAHASGIKVHVWTVRNDNVNHVAIGPWPPAQESEEGDAVYLKTVGKTIVAADPNIPAQFEADVLREIDFLVKAKVDGIFTDNVNTLTTYLVKTKDTSDGISPTFIGGVVTSVLSLLALLAF